MTSEYFSPAFFSFYVVLHILILFFRWNTNWDIAAAPASTSCVTLSPDLSPSYVDDDPLPEGRTMGNLILLPNGKILLLNGAGCGMSIRLTKYSNRILNGICRNGRVWKQHMGYRTVVR